VLSKKCLGLSTNNFILQTYTYTQHVSISSKGQSSNQSPHLLLSNTHRSIKLKLIQGNRRYIMWTTSGNGQVSDMDSTCKYANNNLTIKTVSDAAWVMGKHPINKEQHLMKCHRRAPNWMDFCNGNRKAWLTVSML
jgi:hypothetical protein